MLSIILTRPEGSINIGSVCRAMKAMDIIDLRLVNASLIDEEDVKKWSLKAFDIYQNAKHFSSLDLAIQDSSWVVGVSRRHGKYRKKYFLNPQEFAHQTLQYSTSIVSLVFGNEKNGLNDEELALCQSLVTIPAHEEHGSLNLSHAVQICAAAVFATQNPKRKREIHFATQKDIKDVVTHIIQGMNYQGLFRKQKSGIKDLTYRKLYDILGKIPLDKSELKFLRHTLDKIVHAERQEDHILVDKTKERDF